jgi:hypothetical protein
VLSNGGTLGEVLGDVIVCRHWRPLIAQNKRSAFCNLYAFACLLNANPFARKQAVHIIQLNGVYF